MTSISLSPSPDPLVANVRIPGSKSFTNRALICAVLADGESQLVGTSPSLDSRLLVSALKQLGADIRIENDTLLIRGTSLRPFSGTLDVGPAGTTMRFLTTLCSLIPGTDVILRGSHRMHQRPIGALVSGLEQLGANIKYLEKTHCPPLQIVGKQLPGGTVKMDGSVSSQFLTALLLTAPLLPNGLRLEISGELVSESYLKMTAHTMHEFGVEVDHPDAQTWIVAPGQKYQATRYEIEADLTGATYFAGLAALSDGTIQLHPFNVESTQGDVQFPALLEKMGCTITHTGNVLIISGSPSLQAIDTDLTLMPDAAQTLAVIAACAKGTSRITGLSTLREKECDRIEALQSELKKLDITTRSGKDWIEVDGGTPKKNIAITTFDDHRMAMSFAILAGRIPITINHPHVVRKSFPDFWRIVAQCGIPIRAATRIIPSVIGRTVDEIIRQVDTLPPTLELIELRVDALEHVTQSMIDDLRRRVERPAIFTCRSVAEGGHWKSSESERIELLTYAALQRWAFIDVELSIAPDWPWKKLRHQAILLSWHDFHGTPDDLETIWNEMQQYPALVRKIVPTTCSEADAERILDLSERHSSQNLIAFGMGEMGRFTRFESIRRGAWGMFAATDEMTAPGQYHWRELQKMVEEVRYPR